MKTVILMWGLKEIQRMQVEDNQFEIYTPIAPPNAMGEVSADTSENPMCHLIFSYKGRHRVCECGKTSFEVFELTKVKIGTCP